MKRSPLNRVSKKRQRENVIRRENLERAWGPRPWSCWLSHVANLGVVKFVEGGEPRLIMPMCSGTVNGHELLKRSQGGSITDPSNMVPLCEVHNSWVEDNPKDAYKLGLVRHAWE